LRLGLKYYYGDGVKQDRKVALRLYHMAAEQENPAIQFELGVMYYEGRGIELNRAEAARLFRKAAEQGHSAAQFNLGIVCDKVMV